MRPKCRVDWVFFFAVGVFGWVASAQVTLDQRPSPPQKPAVAPLIGKRYPNDSNGDRIEDQLFGRAQQALAAQKAAFTKRKKAEAEAKLQTFVEVELIFTDQITQRQIDDFLARGGEVTYVYKTVSHGWNGRIPLGQIIALPAAMGDTLVLVEEIKPAELHLDMATMTGRARPVWASGFAGNASGFHGNTNITIAIVDTGVDETHADLNGRRVYWKDFSSDNQANPSDLNQHGSHVAGIALGTGAAAGSAAGTMRFTQIGSLSGVSSGSFFPNPVELPTSSTTVTMTAMWNGGGSTTLNLFYHTKGTSGGWTAQSSGVTGTSPLTLDVTLTGNHSRVYSPALLSNGAATDFVVTVEVPNYPGSSDGFNKLRGVAPGCNWAGAKVFANAGSGQISWTGAAVDDLVSNRVAKKIKVMNLSLGTIGDPGLSTTTRQKVNSAVNNGIVVCVSAGNDGAKSAAGQREIDDPGRAAMALTVAAANDTNQLTSYTSHGFTSPSSSAGQEEDYKPDIMAPGGSVTYYTSILSVDSNSGDGTAFGDQQTNDAYNIHGTSMSSPFVAGAAALVVEALEQSGVTWNFNDSQHSRYVKMVLCATASESNANRDSGTNNPTLERASAGPNGYPVGKDQFEGYGMLNPDAAVEAVSQTMVIGSMTNAALGPTVTDRRVWARTISFSAGQAMTASLINPSGGDFDLYLYSASPSAYGNPVILASSTQAGLGANESFNYTASSNHNALLAVKRISGSGTFNLTVAPPAPVLGGIESTPLSYVENQAATAITSSLTVSASGASDLAGGEVRITSGFATGQDVLSLAPNPQNGISATYNASTGVLTLTGASSPANYQAALRSVTYANSSDNPSTANRTVSFHVSDGSADSNTQTRNIAVSAVNDAPVLAAIANQTVNEGQTLTFGVFATDADLPGDVLTFSLDPGSPPGAAINAASGVFAWTPSEADGPGIYNVTVRVTDNGSPNLSDTQTFSVTVNEVNVAPTLAFIANRALIQGNTLRFTNSASDADLPANTLTFSLEPGFPNGMSLDPNSGVLAWSPTEGQSSATYNVSVRVSDDGSPVLSDVKSFSITVITPGVDTNKPTVAIASPASNARVFVPSITVSGTAKDKAGAINSGVASVLISINGGEQQSASTTNDFSNWTANVTLNPGLNAVVVTALDYAGNFQSVTRSFFHVVLSTLTLATNGSGGISSTITKFGMPTNQAQLELTKPYTVTAIPAANHLFSNWVASVDGGPEIIVSTNAKYTFAMQTNLSLNATFVTNHFIAASGAYSGLFYETNRIAHHSAGFVSVKVKTNLSFSAKLIFDGDTVSTSGKFDLSGVMTKTISRAVKGKGDVTLSLKLGFGVASNLMTGTVSNGTNWLAELKADRAVFSALNQATGFTNKYTMLIPGFDDATNGPPGYSYAAMTVTRDGFVKLSGAATADGQTLSQSVPVSQNGEWPFYAPLYKTTRVYTNLLTLQLKTNAAYPIGSMLGWLTFTNDAPTGMVAWINSIGSGAIYPSGFTNDSIVLGSRYLPPVPGNRAVDIVNGTVTMANGNLFTAITRNLFVNTNNAMVITPTNQTVKLSLIASKGLLSGSFKHPDNTNATTFIKGVVLQEQKFGGGFFLGTNQGGLMVLE